MKDLDDTFLLADLPQADKTRINAGLLSAGNRTMLAVIGNPRGGYNQNCQPVTNPRLADLIVTEDVGPFGATGLSPAIIVLRRIFDEVSSDFPAIFAALGTAGMLCCRFVRGSQSVISNHAWGTAIDLTVGGVLDPRGDGRLQQALYEIYPIFNRHGFFWGATFGIEDAMHFEVSDQLIRKWAAEGTFGATKPTTARALVSIGDRGPQVAEVQRILDRLLGGAGGIDIDGRFGPATQAAVMELQRQRGLRVDGVVNAALLAAMRAAD